MSDKDQEGFYRGTRRYVAILLAAAPLFALSRFVQGKLGLDWRRWLTEHLCGLYFGNRAFYALKIGYLSPSKTTTTTDGEESRAAGAGDDAARQGEEEEQRGGIDNPVSAVSCGFRLRGFGWFMFLWFNMCTRRKTRQRKHARAAHPLDCLRYSPFQVGTASACFRFM